MAELNTAGCIEKGESLVKDIETDPLALYKASYYFFAGKDLENAAKCIKDGMGRVNREDKLEARKETARHIAMFTKVEKILSSAAENEKLGKILWVVLFTNWQRGTLGYLYTSYRESFRKEGTVRDKLVEYMRNKIRKYDPDKKETWLIGEVKNIMGSNMLDDESLDTLNRYLLDGYSKRYDLALLEAIKILYKD